MFRRLAKTIIEYKILKRLARGSGRSRRQRG